MANPMQPTRKPVMGANTGATVAMGGQHPRVVGTAPVNSGGKNIAGSAAKVMASKGKPVVNTRGSGAQVKPVLTGTKSGIRITPPTPPKATFSPASGWVSSAPPQTADGYLKLNPDALHSPTWQANQASEAYGYQQQRDALNQQLAGLDSQYAVGEAARKDWYQRDAENSNADLAARGIFNSGSRDRALVDRNVANATQVQSLDKAYGTSAKNAITAALAGIGQQQTLQTNADNAAARDEFVKSFPLAPKSNITGAQSQGVQKYAPKGASGWKAGQSGQFYRDGQWHWINAAGDIEHGVAHNTNPRVRTFS